MVRLPVALERIHRRKTGALLRASLRLGGLVARAGERHLAALDAFGQRLGLAFQVVDDLLDLRGNEHALGKRTGKDSTHGKSTFPALLGVEQSQEYAARLIDEALAELAPLGNAAAPLAAVARYVLERDR